MDSGFSVRSIDEINDIFSPMIFDSPTDSELCMTRTKNMYDITHGLAPYFKSILVNSLNKSDLFVYSYDESLNKIT